MDVEYTFANLPNEIVQLILVFVPKLNFLQYSVVCKLWHHLSNSIGFWKQSCLELLGPQISPAKWTPELIEALGKTKTGSTNLLVPIIVKENSQHFVDWRRTRFATVKRNWSGEELSLDLCSKYFESAQSKSVNKVPDFLLACDLFVLLMSRDLPSEANGAYSKIRSTYSQLKEDSNNALLMGVKLRQVFDSRSIDWSQTKAKEHGINLLKMAVQCFRALKTVGRTSQRLFRGLCCDVINLTQYSKCPSLEFGDKYRFKMITKTSSLLKHPELDQDLFNVIWHNYYQETSIKVKDCALAAFFITSSCRQSYGEEMIKIALNASGELDYRLKKTAAIVLCYICKTNKAALLAIPDETFLQVVIRLIEYLGTHSYSFKHGLRALGSLPMHRASIVPDGCFAKLNQILLNNHWNDETLSELPRLGLAFGKLFNENGVIFSYGNMLRSQKNLLKAIVTYIELGKNALREYFDDEIKALILCVMNGSYFGLNIVDFIVNVKHHIVRLYANDWEMLARILSTLLTLFSKAADTYIATQMIEYKLGSAAIMNEPEVKELPYTMDQYIKYLETKISDPKAEKNYFEEEKVDCDGSEPMEVDHSYVIEPLSDLPQKSFDLNAFKVEVKNNSSALETLMYLRPTLKDLFKPIAQSVLHWFFAEMILVECNATNINSILILLRDMKPHLDPLDLHKYLCLLVQLVTLNSKKKPVRQKLGTLFSYCIKECMTLFMESSVPHYGTLHSLLGYFTQFIDPKIACADFPDMHAVLVFLDSICRKWPRIAFAAYSAFLRDPLNVALDNQRISKLFAVTLPYFRISYDFDDELDLYLETYRSIPETCEDSKVIFQRAIYIIKAENLNHKLSELNLFNFSTFELDQISEPILRGLCNTGNNELDILAKKAIVPPDYDEKCLFQQHGKPVLRLFFGALRSE